MVKPSFLSKSEFLRTLVGAGAVKDVEVTGDVVVMTADVVAEMVEEVVVEGAEVELEDEVEDGLDDENEDEVELAEEVDGATELEVEDVVGSGRMKVVVDVGTTAEELEVGTTEEGVEADSVDEKLELVVLDSAGRNRYRLRRFPAPQNSAGFPGHGKLHSERLVGVLLFTVLILLPQKHSLPYSTPKKLYLLQAVAHRATVMESL